jgi:hypothetical protein
MGHVQSDCPTLRIARQVDQPPQTSIISRKECMVPVAEVMDVEVHRVVDSRGVLGSVVDFQMVKTMEECRRVISAEDQIILRGTATRRVSNVMLAESLRDIS